MEEVNVDAWVYELSLEQLRAQARLRGLSDAGSQSVLRERVLRYERSLRGEGLLSSPVVELPPPSFVAAEGKTEKVTELGESPIRTATDADIQRALRDSIPRPVTMPRGLSQAENRNSAWNLPRATASRSSTSGELSTSEACREMRRWNVSFSGARGSDAEDFLIRIREGREVTPISDDDLLKCLPFFLSGIALEWYRVKKTQLRSWREFESAWRARFGDPDFQFALRDEIRWRTQGEEETVADYLTNLAGMFNRLDPPWSMTEQLNYAHRNMLPRLQIVVRRHEVVDLDSLEMLAIRAEISYRTASQYMPPPPPERSVCPNHAYRPPPRVARSTAPMTATVMPEAFISPPPPVQRESRVEPVTPAPRERGAPPQPKPRRRKGPPENGEAAPRSAGAPPRGAEGGPYNAAPRSTPADRCWNCDKEGHFSRGCRAPLRMHCYQCGKPDVTTKTCPRCAGNGGRRS